MLNYSTTDLNIFLGKAEVKLTELGTELYKQITYGEASEGLVDDINLLSDIIDEIEVSTIQEEIDILVNFALDYYNLSAVAYSPFNVLPTTVISAGGGGGGVSSHKDLLDVSILELSSTPTIPGIAWHISTPVAQGLLGLLSPPPPDPVEGVFFTIFPGSPVINTTDITETDSEISLDEVLHTIFQDTLPFVSPADGFKRFDAVVVNLTSFTYEILTGVEVPENEAAATPTIGDNYLFVRYLEITDGSVTPTDSFVKGITINSTPPTLFPDGFGVVDLPVVHTNRVQNNMALDGTAQLIPTIDGVNNFTNTVHLVSTATGFTRTDDNFTLSKFDDNTLGVSASQYGIIFSAYFTVPPFEPEAGIKFLTARNIPLTDVGVIPVNSQVLKYVGWQMPSDTIVFSDTSFVQSKTVCQLGLVFVKNVAGVYSFTDVNRTFINMPDVSAYCNLLTTVTGVSSNVVITHTGSGMTTRNTAGSIKGISVNWGGGNTDERSVAATSPMSFTFLNPGIANTISVPAPTTILDPTQYWNGAAMVPLTGANNAQVMRVTLTIRGTFIIQPGETQYTNLADAKDNVFTQQFTDIIPKGTFVEVGRIAVIKAAINLANNADAVFYTTSGGGGGSSAGGLFSTLGGSPYDNALLSTELKNAQTQTVTFRCNSDVSTTSDSFALKGLVVDVTEDRMAEDGSVPASGAFTYSYRLSSSAVWTSGQTLAQLKTQLMTSTASTITWVRATNVVTLGISSTMLTIKKV